MNGGFMSKGFELELSLLISLTSGSHHILPLITGDQLKSAQLFSKLLFMVEIRIKSNQ
jgi:hypothetical protein